MNLRFNPNLDALPVYQPGRPIDEVARELGLPQASFIKLASNENPLGPSPKAVEAMRAAIGSVHLYPDGSSFHLKQALASKLGVSPANLVLGNGSNEVLELVGHALITPASEVVVSDYSFAVYPIVTRLFGGRLISVPARDLGHDLPAMLAACTPDTTVMFVANPNNPTGTRASSEDLRNLVAQVPDHVLLVVDEAYIEFLDDPLDLIPEILAGRPNLLLCRTFSKIHGLAGLRLGYGIGHPQVIAALEKIREPFNVNSLAQAGALAALADDAHVTATRETNRAGLAFLGAELARLGIPFIPSAANFLLIRTGDGARAFQALQAQGVITRPVGAYKLPEWLRISVGTAAENTRCIQALARFLKNEG